MDIQRRYTYLSRRSRTNVSMDRSGGHFGSAEICSSLYSFLQSISLHSYRKIKTFSDCCSGQNRNRNIIAFFMYICHKYQIEEWEHTYMESGHSYLPNDRDFSSIEKKSKRTTHIYSMEE